MGYIRPYGNVGDALIEMATAQLFAEFGVRWTVQDVNCPLEPSLDHLVYGGGGNMGILYCNNWEQRGLALRYGLPLTIFPQSFTSIEGRDYTQVFARERDSLAYCETAELAPDLALGLKWKRKSAADKDLGVFLRHDGESAVSRPWFIRDPARICREPEQYLRLAASYRRIVTDRLHFAISGLIAGCEVVILRNSYHKNRAMYATWLADLGCKFADSLKDALAALDRAERARSRFWRRAA